MSILRRISENRRISDISRASTVINFYQPFTDRKLQRILILEYLGTTLFGIGLQSAKDDFQIQLVIFFLIRKTAMLLSARHSGAHYHIAVTLILMFRPHYPINRFRGVLQIIVGILGFMTGAYFGYHMLNICYLLTGHISSPRLQSHEQIWIISDLCGEILATTSFQFMNVLLFERKTAVFKTPVYNTILLTLAIYYSRKLSPHSGGCMNPTIAIGMNLAVAYVENRSDILRNDVWLFVAGPLIGSFIVYILYYCIIQPSTKLCNKYKSMGI